MKRFLVSGIISACLSVVGLCAIPVVYTVDAGDEQGAISELIYGTNFDEIAGANLTVRRTGGNRLTGYNWENNYSNAGSDWYHHSDTYMSGYLPVGQRTMPGRVMYDFVQGCRNAGQESLVTLQMAGYVAADKDGTVDEDETAPSDRWEAVEFKKPGPFCEPAGQPDVTDGVVYMDELVNYLVDSFGRADEGGVQFFTLDNEPALWSSTHARIHPEQPGCVELVERSVELAGAVKDVDDSAKICGPVLYGFSAFNSFQGAPDWDAVKSGYDWFIEYYLDEMRQAELSGGRRLLDVLDLHWYPEAQDDNGVRITYYEATATNWQARMQAPRSLWDDDYVEKSWIGQWFSRYLPLLPRVWDSIDEFYPGTELAFTEYDYGGKDHISGGIAQADVLGIFGKYGVMLATYWGRDGDYINAAFRLYRNYDGAESVFGDISVAATMSDKVNSSIYASISNERSGMMTMVVLNKHLSEAIEGTFNLAGMCSYGSARVWGFDSSSATITERGGVADITGNTFSYTIPAMSAYLFEITADYPAGDIDGDCVIDFADVVILARQWLSTTGCEGIGCADLTGDGRVNLDDLAVVNTNYEGHVRN